MREAFKQSIKQQNAAGEIPKGVDGMHLPPPQGVAPIPKAPDPQRLQEEDALPDFKRASSIASDAIQTPPIMIENLLHRSCKLAIGGGSKSFKSWALLDLAMSVSSGQTWWDLHCKQGVVLYLNFELIEGFFEKRLEAISKARNLPLPDNFLYWSPRSKCYDLGKLEHVLRSRKQEVGNIDLIIIDPVYKALGDLDENSAGDMTELMGQIESISDEFGSAIAFGAHFSKGNQSAKEAIDRISGSGVFSRDPDAILTLTPHEEENAFVVESRLRYLPMLPDFCLRWDFPLMKVDDRLDPALLNQGKKKEVTDEADDLTILNALPYEGLNLTAWRKRAIAAWGSPVRNFNDVKNQLMAAGSVVRRGHVYYRVNLNLNQQ